MAGEAGRFILDDDTLFLLGNGPSLASVDLRALSPYATLGMNAAYRYWDEIGWRPRYYACLDHVVGRSHREAIGAMIGRAGALGMEGFVLRESLIRELGAEGRSSLVYNLDALASVEPRLGVEPVTTGSHAALWAAAVGFRKIVILGVDGNYVEKVGGAARRDGIELEIVEDGDNPNYFFPGYQRPGDRFNVPNPRPGLHAGAWDKVAAIFAHDGIMAANANPASEVRVFPFVDAAVLLRDGAAPLAAAPRTANADFAAVLAERDGAPGGRGAARRLARILSAQKGLIIAAAALTAAGLAAAILAAGFNGVRGALATAGALWLLFLLVLHLRTTSSDHIGRLERRIAQLEAAVADAGRPRLQRPPRRAPGGEDR